MPSPEGRRSDGGSGRSCRGTPSASPPGALSAGPTKIRPTRSRACRSAPTRCRRAPRSQASSRPRRWTLDAEQQLVARVQLERVAHALRDRDLSLGRDLGSCVHSSSLLSGAGKDIAKITVPLSWTARASSRRRRLTSIPWGKRERDGTALRQKADDRSAPTPVARARASRGPGELEEWRLGPDSNRETTTGIVSGLSLTRSQTPMNTGRPVSVATDPGASVPRWNAKKTGRPKHHPRIGKLLVHRRFRWRDPDLNRRHHDFQ